MPQPHGRVVPSSCHALDFDQSLRHARSLYRCIRKCRAGVRRRIRIDGFPDSSALVAVPDDRWVLDVERDMKEAQARVVIGSQIASH